MTFIPANILVWSLGVAMALAAACSVGAGTPVVTQSLSLRPGIWEVRSRDGGGGRRLCVRDQGDLIRLRHPGRACDGIVLEQTLATITVQYTCRGSGFGRTQLRRETPQLVQIATQGIADGLPFEFSAEGRWVRDCDRVSE